MLYNSESGVPVRTGCEDIRPDVRLPAGHLETKPQRRSPPVKRSPCGVTEPRGVVGLEVILGAYSPLSMATTSLVPLSGYSSAMEASDG